MHGAVRFIWLLSACSTQRGYRLIFRDLVTLTFDLGNQKSSVLNWDTSVCQIWCRYVNAFVSYVWSSIPTDKRQTNIPAKMQIYASDNTVKLLVAGRCSAFISIRCDTPFVHYVGLCGNKGVTSWTMCWLFFIFYIWRPGQQQYLYVFWSSWLNRRHTWAKCIKGNFLSDVCFHCIRAIKLSIVQTQCAVCEHVIELSRMQFINWMHCPG